MLISVNCDGLYYSVDPNREHYFGDKDGGYRLSDFDINFILTGTYRRVGHATLISSDDMKSLDHL